MFLKTERSEVFRQPVKVLADFSGCAPYFQYDYLMLIDACKDKIPVYTYALIGQTSRDFADAINDAGLEDHFYVILAELPNYSNLERNIDVLISSARRTLIYAPHDIKLLTVDGDSFCCDGATKNSRYFVSFLSDLFTNIYLTVNGVE